MGEIIIRHADKIGWTCSNKADKDAESSISEDRKSMQVRNTIRVSNSYTVEGELKAGDTVNVAFRHGNIESYHNCIVRVLSPVLCKLEITELEINKSQVIYG